MPSYPLYGIAETSLPFALERYKQNNSRSFTHLWLQDLHVLHRHLDFYKDANLTEPESRENIGNSIVNRYYDIVRHIDSYIEEFLHGIYEIDDNVLVIINSDHGEALGEKPTELNDAKWFADDGRQYDHGYPNQIENNLIHTPCIMKPPGWKRGVRMRQLVSVNDLYDTIRSYLPDATNRNDIKHSWKYLLDEEKTQQHRFVIADTRWWSESDRASALVTEDGYKLIQYADKSFQLFDLKNDPSESYNLFAEGEVKSDSAVHLYNKIELLSYKYLQNKPNWEMDIMSYSM